MIVMCGLPAAGKSTVAAELATRCHAVVLSADDVRVGRRPPAEVFAWLHAEVIRALGDDRTVVLDVCALHASERDRWRGVGRRADARCELVVVHTPWQVCRNRNRARCQPARVVWSYMVPLFRRTLIDVYREGWDRVRIHRPPVDEVLA